MDSESIVAKPVLSILHVVVPSAISAPQFGVYREAVCRELELLLTQRAELSSCTTIRIAINGLAPPAGFMTALVDGLRVFLPGVASLVLECMAAPSRAEIAAEFAACGGTVLQVQFGRAPFSIERFWRQGLHRVCDQHPSLRRVFVVPYGVRGATLAEIRQEVVLAVQQRVEGLLFEPTVSDHGTLRERILAAVPSLGVRYRFPLLGDLLRMGAFIERTLLGAGYREDRVHLFVENSYELHQLGGDPRQEDGHYNWIGIGAGAARFERQGQQQILVRNVQSVSDYIHRFVERRDVVSERESVAPKQILQQRLGERIRSKREVLLPDLSQGLDSIMERRLQGVIQIFQETGLLESSNRAITFTRHGLIMADEIAAELADCLSAGPVTAGQ